MSEPAGRLARPTPAGFSTKSRGADPRDLRRQAFLTRPLPQGERGLPDKGETGGYLAGFTNLSVMRSDSPIVAYLARSLSPSAKFGGSVQTPFG